NGNEFVAGAGKGFFGAGAANTTIPGGAEIRAETESPGLDISLTELEDGSWVIFELPGFVTASAGTQRSSLDALRTASDTSFYNDGSTLWLKLVASSRDNAPALFPGFGGGTSIQVRKTSGEESPL